MASLDSIYWERDIVDGEDLIDRLRHAETIMHQPQELPLRLLIIDSIAHLFRDVGDNPGVAAFAQRTGVLFRISSMLRRLADLYNLAVVVTNQVHSYCVQHQQACKCTRVECTIGAMLTTYHPSHHALTYVCELEIAL